MWYLEIVGHCYIECHHLNQANRTSMRKNLEANFTYELGLNLGIFKMKLSLDMQSHCFPKHIDISPRVFFLSTFQKKIIKCVFMCRNFTIPFIQTIPLTLGLKLSKEDMNYKLTLLFLYNAEARYAIQLRHLNSKIQRGYITRKSCVWWKPCSNNYR